MGSFFSCASLSANSSSSTLLYALEMAVMTPVLSLGVRFCLLSGRLNATSLMPVYSTSSCGMWSVVEHDHNRHIIMNRKINLLISSSF